MSKRPREAPTPWQAAPNGDRHVDIVDADGNTVFAAVAPDQADRLLDAVNGIAAAQERRRDTPDA